MAVKGVAGRSSMSFLEAQIVSVTTIQKILYFLSHNFYHYVLIKQMEKPRLIK